MFLRNSWYVFGWTDDVPNGGDAVGRVIIGEPIVVWRSEDSGVLHAAENRCPHRHAALSLGRVEGSAIRCLYHGMKFGTDGRCIDMPLAEKAPDASIRIYPVVEKDSWIWVWTGDPRRADEGLIPDAFGVDDPEKPMKTGSIEYDANYQLVHDNLCDLSHVDYVHDTTLRVTTGAYWAQSTPNISIGDRAIRFERWFENAEVPDGSGARVDAWITYDFAVPGIFIMHGARYEPGTAKKFEMKEPLGVEPIGRNFEQQAVTPISATRTAYHFATGLVGATPEMTRKLAKRMEVIMAAFEEDRVMIEAQQRIWDLTSPTTRKVFLPQDRGPFLMRKLMARLIREEAGTAGE